MIVYILMLIISIIFLILAQKTKHKKLGILYYILATLPFFIVSSFRYGLGVDYHKRYVWDFSNMSKGMDIPNLEIGFKLLIQFIQLFSNDYVWIFIISSAIIIGCIMTTIVKKSNNVILSVLIFFVCGHFFYSLNIMRQYIAIAIILFSYQFLLKKKQKIWYALGVILATTIHSTSIVMLALLFLDKKMLGHIKVVLPITAIILILNTKLFDIIGLLIQNTRFSIYLTGKLAVGDISVILMIENILLYLGMYYIYKKNQKRDIISTEDILFLNIQAITVVIIALGAIHSLFFRIVFYFSIFQVISIPHFIERLDVKDMIEDIKKITKDKIKLTKLLPKMKLIITIFIMIIFTMHFFRTFIIFNECEVIPYKTIFAKDIEIY